MWTGSVWMPWHLCCISITANRMDSGLRINMAEMRILMAIEFFKHLNSVVLGRNKGAVLIAEESTAWPKVTGAPEDDGLGLQPEMEYGLDA